MFLFCYSMMISVSLPFPSKGKIKFCTYSSSPSPHAARRFIQQEFGDGGDLHVPPSSGFPYSGMISFRIGGGLNKTDAFLTSRESLRVLAGMMTHG